MWRFIHSIPRALRQCIHNPRPSAGLCNVDDEVSESEHHDEADRQCFVASPNKHPLCAQSAESLGDEGHNGRLRLTRLGNDDDGWGEDKKCNGGTGGPSGSGGWRWWHTCQHDIWGLVHGSHRALEAITVGSAMAWGNDWDHLRRQKLNLLWRVLCAVGPNKPRAALGVRDKFVSDQPTRSVSVLVQNVAEEESGKASQAVGGRERTEADEALDSVIEEFETMCTEHRACHESVLGLHAIQSGNMEAAVQHLRSSCMLGNSSACFNLALCYETGSGVVQDLDKAKIYYSKAAQAGHKMALYNLGLLYLNEAAAEDNPCEGAQGAQSYNKGKGTGLSFLEKAASAGLVEAQLYLGVRQMEEGEDAEKAVSYFTAAAEQNDSEAQYFLAICYEQGLGVEQNECRAAQLYSQAASAGHENAMYNLAVFNENGLGGIPEDPVAATELYAKAAQLGSVQAAERLEQLQAHKRQSTGTAHQGDNMSMFQYLYQLYSQDGLKHVASQPDLSGSLSPSASSPNLSVDWNPNLWHPRATQLQTTTTKEDRLRSVFDPGGCKSSFSFLLGGEGFGGSEESIERAVDCSAGEVQRAEVCTLHRSNTSPNLATAVVCM